MKHPFLTVLLFLAAFIAYASAADVAVTAANVIVSPRGQQYLTPGIYGEAVTAGQVVTQSSTDGKFYLADANVTAKALVAGIAVNSGAANQPATICTEDPDFTPGFTLSLSTPVYVASATPGGIAPSADLTTGWKPTVLMVATSTSKASFRARGHVGTAQ